MSWLNSSVRKTLAIPAGLGREDKVFPIADLPVTPAVRSCIAHPSRLLRENIGIWNTLNNLLTALAFALLNREVDIITTSCKNPPNVPASCRSLLK